MGGLLKILFDILKEPLGLPLNIVEEYIVLAIMGEAAYQLAYEKTGKWGRGFTPGEKSIMHWVIRAVYYVGMWAVLRVFIALYDFVVNNKILSLVIAFITAFIIVGIIVYVKYKRRRLVQDELEDDSDELE